MPPSPERGEKKKKNKISIGLSMYLYQNVNYKANIPLSVSIKT